MRAARWAAIALASLLAFALGATLRFARAIVTPPKRLPAELRILGVDRTRGRILLSSTPATRASGRFGLWFGNDTGYLRVGSVTGETAKTVERELLDVVMGSPRAGMPARDSGWYYLTPSGAGLEADNVVVDGPLGSLPAWHVAPVDASTDWVVHIHGRTASRAETIRSMLAVRPAGWHSLAISYRNDAGAPSSPDGRYGLGATEWRDVEAAISFARDRGAERVVLFGWSMGGMIALRTVAELGSASPVPIVGVILESAVISWPNVFRQQARIAHMPEGFALAASALLDSPAAPSLTGLAEPIDWRRLDGPQLAVAADLPLLALHGTGDAFVPIEPIRELADRFPGFVELHEFRGAGHVRLWNVEPERWSTLIQDWLARR